MKGFFAFRFINSKKLKTMETLEKFLKQNQACKDGYDFAKNLTLEQFLKSCDRGDWILWLFQRSNPDSLRELTLTKGYCANTVRHKMKDARSIKALDATIAFGEGKISKKDLDTAAADAADAAAAAAGAATYSATAAADFWETVDPIGVLACMTYINVEQSK